MLCRRWYLSDTEHFSQHCDGTKLSGLPYMASEKRGFKEIFIDSIDLEFTLSRVIVMLVLE